MLGALLWPAPTAALIGKYDPPTHTGWPQRRSTGRGAPGSMQNVANHYRRQTFGAICTPDVQDVANVLAG
jgi:hypothetical protein